MSPDLVARAIALAFFMPASGGDVAHYVVAIDMSPFHSGVLLEQYVRASNENHAKRIAEKLVPVARQYVEHVAAISKMVPEVIP